MRRAERTLMPTFAAAASCSSSFRCNVYLATVSGWCVCRAFPPPSTPEEARLKPLRRSIPGVRSPAKIVVVGRQDNCHRPAMTNLAGAVSRFKYWMWQGERAPGTQVSYMPRSSSAEMGR
jgi:hypothetical protein